VKGGGFIIYFKETSGLCGYKNSPNKKIISGRLTGIGCAEIEIIDDPACAGELVIGKLSTGSNTVRVRIC
jgi:hypothetical protein